MKVQIKLAETASELEDLFRARHRVFAEEACYVPRNDGGMIFEDIDFSKTGTWNVIAVIDGRIVGGTRLCRASLGLQSIGSYFDFTPHLRDTERVAVGGQLFVEASSRGKPGVVHALMSVFHQTVRSQDFSYVIGVCAPPAERYMLGVGYKALAPRFFHAEKRLHVLPVLLDVQDAIRRDSDFGVHATARVDGQRTPEEALRSAA